MTGPQADFSFLVDYLRHPVPSDVDDKGRERLIATCQNIVASLETPVETARKSAFLTLDHAVTRSAIRLGIFELLSRSDEAHSSLDLAAATTPPLGATLLSRLLRYLASPLRLVTEDGPDLWRATSRGNVLADPGLRAGCAMYFDSCGPAFQALPQWLCVDRDSERTATTPFRAAVPDTKDFFSWLQSDGSKLQDFHTWMHVLATNQMPSQQFIDLSEWIHEGISTDGVAFVDVGGGDGGQCMTLRERRGTRPGRIVNQDRAEVVETTRVQLETKGIESMAHDFFADQPIRGAHVYHFRQIFHDWPDQDCVNVLKCTRDAMSAASTLLIDEVVLPEKDAHWMVTQRDMTMLTLFNSAERSETQWRALLAKAGLRVQEIRCYDSKMAACVIVAKPL